VSQRRSQTSVALSSKNCVGFVRQKASRLRTRLRSDPGTGVAKAPSFCVLMRSSLNPRSFVGLSFTLKDANLEADPDHPLLERTISFTGTMFSMTRDEAKDAIADVGATWREQPSKNVDMLVIGDADFVSFADGDRTSKLTKAINLKANGHQIEIMAESDFLALL
jgi:DNA polymerase-3 subunit epsilon